MWRIYRALITTVAVIGIDRLIGAPNPSVGSEDRMG
jgi:hypothetical protein